MAKISLSEQRLACPISNPAWFSNLRPLLTKNAHYLEVLHTTPQKPGIYYIWVYVQYLEKLT